MAREKATDPPHIKNAYRRIFAHDAILVITAEKTGIREIISLDRDFDIYRLPGKEKITNIYK